FFFVINWRMFPLQLAVTYSVDLNGALFTSDEVGAPYAVAFRRYIQLIDADRNSKLKVIPRVVEGPWLVKKLLKKKVPVFTVRDGVGGQAVGQTPTIIGRKL
ncbi:WD repeat-containing protein 12, partial [Perkinsus olseni]